MSEEFVTEQRKRDARVTVAQRIAWGDSLLAQLPDSASYRNKCRVVSRLAEQAELNRLVQEWLASRQEKLHNDVDQFSII